MAIAAGFPLIRANFINQTTAGSSDRMKEVGVRKTFNAPAESNVAIIISRQCIDDALAANR